MAKFRARKGNAADPDVFARHRLFQRTIAVLIAQIVAVTVSADQIYQLIDWSDAVKYETRLWSIEQMLKCNWSNTSSIPAKAYNSSSSICCSPRTRNYLLNALKSFDIQKDAGLSAFILVFSLSSVGFIVTLSNYVGFIKSRNIYLRKFVLNAIVLVAFVTQCISCASFDSGVRSKIKASQDYCQSEEASYSKEAYACLTSIINCPSASLLYSYQVIMIITTTLIPVVIIYSCKWRERVFARLSDELAFSRKSSLFTLQRSMLHNVKTELEFEQEFERRTLEKLEESLLEEYNILRAYEQSLREHDASNVKTAMTHELQHYLEKLTEYNQQLSALMNKAEAMKELKKLDMQILDDYRKYLNSVQKLPETITATAGDDSESKINNAK